MAPRHPKPGTYVPPWSKAGMTYVQWNTVKKVAHGTAESDLNRREVEILNRMPLSREEAIKKVLEFEPKPTPNEQPNA